jgi:uncharacterized membrane protein YidH (DUF202 family)
MSRDADPGLAVERTSLAATRSALALVAVAALLVRLGLEAHAEAVASVVAGGDLAVAGLLWLHENERRRPRASAMHGHEHVPDERLPVVVSAATVATALCAIVLALLD